jgi:CRISPR-associated endonuclease/helicase Cas3
MAWHPWNGTWVPALHLPDEFGDPDSVLQALIDGLPRLITEHPARLLRELEKDGGVGRREQILQLARNAAGTDRDLVDWLAAIASDVAPPEAINQLQTTRRDYHPGNLASVIDRTTEAHLRRALFHSWDYSDSLDNQSLHLDPGEDRRHAYQWYEPSGDPNRKKTGGMLGANRLAIEAIPLFTSLPEGKALHTVGFTGSNSTNTRWTWPLWSVSIPLPVVRSLLVLPELQSEELGERAASTSTRERGIVAVYRTYRILVGKTPNFTPARRIA